MMKPLMKFSIAATLMMLAAPNALATNGMNQESYGAKAGGMGGASVAYDSRNSGMMNNPATLALRPDGWDFGIGFTWLAPDVSAQLGAPNGPSFQSSGSSYLMPSLSLIRKQGAFAYGFGISAQGGMGSEYGGDFAAALTQGQLNAPQRSEIGFVRLMLPLAYQVNDALTIAGQIDYGMVTLDLKMLDPATGGYVSVSDNSHFNGQMKGHGWGYTLGAHYTINPAVSVGAAYHSQTRLSDLTGAGTINNTTPSDFRVVDFQWPANYTVGVAWNIQPNWMVTADIKRLLWSNTMKNFNFGPKGYVSAMPMNWQDQTVFMIGTQYKISPEVALRAGFNYGKNPIPSDTLNYLFPAITERHYTLGVGWDLHHGHSIAASFMYTPKVRQTGTGLMNSGLTMSHSQTAWGLNYNYQFK